MPAQGDFFRTQYVTEISGVATVSVQYWQIDDLGSVSDLNSNLSAIAAAYGSAVNGILSTAAVLTCVVYDNLTQTAEKGLVITNNPGGLASGSHPQDQPVRFNRYARNDTDTMIRVSAFNQSGVGESLSTRGRVNNVVPFESLRQFLQNQLVLPADCWTIQPVFRWRTAAGPPPVYIFRPLDLVLLNTKFQKLASRKTRLCGQA